MVNICIKFHLNPSTKYGDIMSREMSVNGRTDGQTEHIMRFTVYCWQRMHKNSHNTV